jgi:uncharacterized protein YjdB
MFARRSSMAVLAGGALLAACADSTTAPEATSPAPVNAAIRTGETFKYIAITNPSTTTYAMTVGATKQMAGTLYYSLGGTLPSSPYATWYSVDPCVASVTSVSPSWGLVKGVKAGTTLIIATAFGKSDTVKVSVTGTGNLDLTCEARLWTFNWSDISFTGTPAPYYPYPKMPVAGATITKLVTFGWKDTLTVGMTRDLKSELRYTDGARLNAESYGARYLSTNGAVATVNSMTGLVTAVGRGRTKIIQNLGSSKKDTIPVFVK